VIWTADIAAVVRAVLRTKGGRRSTSVIVGYGNRRRKRARYAKDSYGAWLNEAAFKVFPKPQKISRGVENEYI
jgi:hypothetical protein